MRIGEGLAGHGSGCSGSRPRPIAALVALGQAKQTQLLRQVMGRPARGCRAA
jgi:hypothetical protein